MFFCAGCFDGYNDSITRAEMATIFDRMMAYRTKAANSFSDLGQSWFTDAILRANAAGLMLGGDGKVRPNDKITRQEAAILICRAMGIPEQSGSSSFADDASIASWAKGYVNALSSAGLIAGVGENRFAPTESINRASVVKMLDNAIKGFYATAGEYTGDVAGNVVVNTANVSLKNMKISGNLIIAEGVGDGDVRLDNVNVAGKLIVRGGGVNSIHIIGGSQIASVIIEKTDDGGVRIVTEGGAVVEAVFVDDGKDDVILTGNFKNVTIAADVPVSAVGANITNVAVTGAGASLMVDSASKVTAVTVAETAAKAEITVKGEVGTLTANAQITVDNQGTIKKAEIKADDVIIDGNKPAEVAVDSSVKEPPKGSDGKPVEGGGSTGGGGGGVPSVVEVSAISVDKEKLTLTVGATEQLTATVETDNATDKTVTWSTSNANIATVSNTGLVSAVKAGTATITAKAGDKTATVSVTVAADLAAAKLSKKAEIDVIVLTEAEKAGKTAASIELAQTKLTELKNAAKLAVEAAETVEAVAALTVDKAAALSLLVNQADLTAYEAALAAVTEADYTAASWTTYQEVVAANVVTVENTQAEVDAATLEITTAQGELVLKVVALAAAKTDAKTALETYVNAKDYTTNAESLVAAIAVGKSAIEDATTEEAVATVLKVAKDVIDEIETDADIAARELATANQAITNAIANVGDVELDFGTEVNQENIVVKLPVVAGIEYTAVIKEGSSWTVTVKDTAGKGTPQTKEIEVTVAIDPNAHIANVGNLDGFKIALEDSTKTIINLTKGFNTTEKILVSRGVTINGGNNTITFTEDASGWQGNYVLHVYNTTGVTIKDIKLTGGDAALLVNGSDVTLTGAIDVSGNEFGGIESSKGKDVTTELKLTVTEATFTNTSEAYGLPTIWEDKAEGTVKTTEEQFTINTAVKTDQVQYYLDAAKAVDPAIAAANQAITDAIANVGNVELDFGTVVNQENIVEKLPAVDGIEYTAVIKEGSTWTVTVKDTVGKGTPQTKEIQVKVAVDPNAHIANVGDLDGFEAALADEAKTVINLTAGFATTEKILVNRAITINGNNKTITFTGDATGWQGNYVLHVYDTTGVTIKDIKLTGGDAALLVNGSEVTLTGAIDVSGNEFGGIESSKGVNVTTNLKLTVTEATFTNGTEAFGLPTIWEDKVTGTVVIADKQFTTNGTVKTDQVQYYLDADKAVDPKAHIAEVKTAGELEAALVNEKVTNITVKGTIGSDSAYTIYNVNRAVTIQGAADAKVFGTFIVKADGVTIDGLAIQNKGDLDGQSSNNRGGIYVFAEKITLTNNTITNGLGENAGLSNAIQIMSPKADNPLSNYVIKDNKLIGHNNEVTNWSSSGIVIAQGYKPGSIGGAKAETITASAEDYQNLLNNNTFTNNKIDLTHQDWSKTGDDVVLYPVPVDETEADVADLAELTAALADENIKTISVTSDIAATAPVVVNRVVTINGGSKTLSFTGLEAITDPNKVDDGLIIQAAATINNLKVDAGLTAPATWVGTYAIHVYGTTATLNNVTATKGNGGILVNGSTVTLTGAINVTGNGFGGIEVSKGKDVATEPTLNVTGATLTNTSEAYGLPTIWEDGVTGKVTVASDQLTMITKGSQPQYYLVEANSTEVDVKNLAELTAALADENIKIINITSDIAATAPVVVNRVVTINGGSKTLSFTGLEAITDPNKADDGLIIQAAATINNLKVDAGLTTPSTWVGTYAIHVYGTTATLNNVTATKGNGGILVNGSTVTLTGAIDVTGNGFGGIEVSKGADVTNDPRLTIADTAIIKYTDTATPAIWIDGKTTNEVNWVVGVEKFTGVEKTDKNQYWFTIGG